MAKNLIGDKWLDASDGGIITITNPATKEVIDTVPESTKKDCDGKPITEAYGEIANVSIGIPAFCEKAKHEYGHMIPAGQEAGNENTLQYTVQAPLGVVVAIIPFNFPSDLFCQKIPPALLMGNSVIMKPSPQNHLHIIL